MKTNLPIVAGGLAALVAAAGVAVGLLVLAGSEPEVAAPVAREASPAPVPAPALDDALATTTRTQAPIPAPVHVAAPAPDPYAPELEASGAVRVRRLVVATGVAGHEPTGAADTFARGTPRLYAFVDAVNESGEEVALRVTFEPEAGESAGHVALTVPARRARHRTWAYTRHVYASGRWHAVVRAPDGRVLARRAFDVVE
ncbi:MAG: DUF2914 domain-containing protein [Sandaracinaceae bacterium]|nr:DUF2914 domain-containing protein [Sandaracinaceae bacterium]